MAMATQDNRETISKQITKLKGWFNHRRGPSLKCNVWVLSVTMRFDRFIHEAKLAKSS